MPLELPLDGQLGGMSMLPGIDSMAAGPAPVASAPAPRPPAPPAPPAPLPTLPDPEELLVLAASGAGLSSGGAVVAPTGSLGHAMHVRPPRTADYPSTLSLSLSARPTSGHRRACCASRATARVLRSAAQVWRPAAPLCLRPPACLVGRAKRTVPALPGQPVGRAVSGKGQT